MKWEYRVIRFYPSEDWPASMEASLNRLGEEGWELVALDHDNDAAVLKRPVPA